MPFQDGEFDFVTAFETVFFWLNLPKDIREVYRVVKSEGRFAVINNYGDPGIDWEIKQFMENAGFTNIIFPISELNFKGDDEGRNSGV